MFCIDKMKCFKIQIKWNFRRHVLVSWGGVYLIQHNSSCTWKVAIPGRKCPYESRLAWKSSGLGGCYEWLQEAVGIMQKLEHLGQEIVVPAHWSSNPGKDSRWSPGNSLCYSSHLQIVSVCKLMEESPVWRLRRFFCVAKNFIKRSGSLVVAPALKQFFNIIHVFETSV